MGQRAFACGLPGAPGRTGFGFGVGPTGRLADLETGAAVRQSLHLLLSTIPGERIMRPTYGCELHRLAFQPNDGTTAGLAIHHVRQAVEAWEPRVEIRSIDAGPHTDHPEILVIRLEYHLRSQGHDEVLEHRFDLGGGNA